jgi:hypothetical protein
MLQHPILINRPIVVTPLGTRLCRPSEVVLDILPDAQKGAFEKEDGGISMLLIFGLPGTEINFACGPVGLVTEQYSGGADSRRNRHPARYRPADIWWRTPLLRITSGWANQPLSLAITARPGERSRPRMPRLIWR